MVYCLYFLQPVEHVSPIRVTASQINNLVLFFIWLNTQNLLLTIIFKVAFMNDILMPNEHLEAVFCLCRLVEENAFTVIPFEIDVSLFISQINLCLEF